MIENALHPLYDDPLYWNGPKGYREPGYADFALNGVRAAYIAAQVKPGGRILDVGCAMGYLVRRLRWRGYDAHGLEISRYALAHAPASIKPYLRQGTAVRLPSPDGFFAFYVSCGVYEHLTEGEAERALAEAKRIAPHGLISLAVEDSSKPQHDDEGHDLLKPLSWWRERMPYGYEVMDDGKEHWIAITPPEAYLREILIHTPWSTDPAVAALADELHRRGYAVWKGVDLDRVLQPGLILEYAAPFDVLSLGQRIAARGVVAVADEAIREDERKRAGNGR